MKLLKRITALIVALMILVLPIIPHASAAFEGQDKVIVVLDPGHGGKDGGAAGIRSEAYYNLEVALAAKAKLEANGNFVVHMTRSTADKYLTLAERLVYADSVNADVVISIHFNSSVSSGMGGVEVYGSVLDRFYLGTLGQKISTKVASAAGINNRGVFRKYDTANFYWSEERQWDIKNDSSVGGLSDYYGIITWGAKFGIPSLIVEHAYLSNGYERNLIEDPAVLKAMGEADADAIIEYYTNHAHSYGDEEIDYPARCFSPGKKSVHCTVCDHRINITDVATPDESMHYWVADGAVTAPTCETDGHGKYYCRYTYNLNDKGCEEFTVCRLDDVTPALGHDYKITEQREVTHTVDGITTYTCSRCSASYSDTVTAEGHSYTLDSHADPDCVKDGYDKYTCGTCGESYSDVIPATGHSFTVKNRVDPACEADGSEDRVCTVCNFAETVTVPATGHSTEIYSDVMPNCTEEGLRITKCTACGKTEETISPKTGHNFAKTAEIAPTCEDKGELKNECIVCGYAETVITDPLGHDFEVTEEIAATCEGEGHKSKLCRTCGKTEVEVIPPAGHVYCEGEVLKSPGLFTKGEEKLICGADGHVEVRPIRDLTLFEYKDQYPAKFCALFVAALLIVVAAIVVVIVVLRKKKHVPTHARSAKSEDEIPHEEQSEEKETVE
ncbi:MAG: N-acetylmuramoyl-L-alanine amidase [Clostridia bacterium]|nr:N-acetylmuramoyl-L-alanine amidase [Clostridia bacterium]